MRVTRSARSAVRPAPGRLLPAAGLPVPTADLSVPTTDPCGPPARLSGPSVATAITLATAALLAGAWTPAAVAAPSSVRRCGTIAVPSTQARAAVSLRGTALPCTTVERVVRAAYRRSVLIADTRPFALRDAGRTYRCRYTPATGGMVCEAKGRRLRGEI